MSNTISNNSNRISGMVSGMDTESMVSQMLQASKIRIQNATQQKILLEWKQDYYKEITNKLNDFRNKYFGSSFNSLSVSNELTKLKPINFNSSYVSINPSSTSVKGDIYIDDIVSLASATRIESTSAITASPIIDVNPVNLSQLTGKSLNVVLDGVEKTITFTGSYNTTADVQSDLQLLLNSSFGSNRIIVDINMNKLTLNAQSGSALTIKNSGITGSEASDVLNFKIGDSNRLNLSIPLVETSLSSQLFVNPEDNLSFKINEKTFTFTSANTMNDIINKVNSSDAGVKMSYSTLSDKFTLTSLTTGTATDITVEDIEGSFNSTVFGVGIKTAGADAVVKLSTNGLTGEENLITITRSTNTFDVEGTSFTLLGKAAGAIKESISAKVEIDADAMVTTVKNFINDYNDLLNSLTSKLSEQKNRDYTPLTEEQKADMTESEITLWTQKAKSGLFQNDMYLKDISNKFQNSFLTGINKTGSVDETIGIIFADAGITTSIYSEKGKLHIDEQKLRNAISKDADKVISLFIQKPNSIFSLYSTDIEKQQRYNESGLFGRISDIIQINLSKTGIKGALINLVGSPGDTYNGQTEYSKRISDMDKKIQDMNDNMAEEETRYWKQFTAMETALSKLNSQSSWLTQQFSSMSN